MNLRILSRKALTAARLLKKGDFATFRRQLENSTKLGRSPDNHTALPKQNASPTALARAVGSVTGAAGLAEQADSTAPVTAGQQDAEGRPAVLGNFAGMLVASLPKTGTVFLQNSLCKGLGRPPLGLPSGGLFPHANIPHEALNRLKSEGAIYVIHCAPNRWNLIEIAERLDRMVVHLRDPRQALISWCHFIREVVAHIDPVQGKHLSMPDDYLEWDFAQQLDWQINHYFPLQIEWIHGWVKAAEELAPGTDILFTTQEQLASDPKAFFDRVLDFYTIPHDAFIYPPKPAPGEMNFRTGELAEWRQKMSWPQIERTTNMIPEALFEYFDWPDLHMLRAAPSDSAPRTVALSIDEASVQAPATKDLICIHHIGGRGGTGRFQSLSAFSGDFHEFLYEADPDASEKIDTASSDRAQRTVWPICVLDEVSSLIFPVFYNAGASSVCPVSSSFLHEYQFLGEGTIDLDDGAWRTVAEYEVNVTSLDEFLRSKPESTYPDFLSINTQGSEAQILRGAEEILSCATIAVMTEVSYIPIYEGQASSEEINQVLGRHGFDLVRVLPHGLRSRSFPDGDGVMRPPIGMRGGGLTAQGDLLYFKAPQAILEQHPAPAVDLAKACFLGFAYEYFDYAYACAKLIDRTGGVGQFQGRAKTRRYMSFVAEFIRCLDLYEGVHVPSWTQVFREGDGGQRTSAEIRAAYFQGVDPERFRAVIRIMTQDDYVGVEKVARQFGLNDQAASLKYYRLSSAWDSLMYLGLAKFSSDRSKVSLLLDKWKATKSAVFGQGDSS